MRLGVLGGAFNPPHMGHMVIAQEALTQLDLDSVVLMPMGQAPHREIPNDPGAEVRVELCEAAVAGDERMGVSRLEVEREGPSFTVDTLRTLTEQRPDDELFWILGGDQAAALGSWHEPDEVIRLCTIAATDRGSWRRAGIYLGAAHLRNNERLVFFEMPEIGVSSTMIRSRVARGRPLRYLVPDGVADLIESRGLYREDAPVTSP